MSIENDLNYIARCKGCGRLVGVTSGEVPQKEQAKDVAAWIRQGYSIEQLTTEAVRKEQWVCKCAKAQPKTPQKELSL